MSLRKYEGRDLGGGGERRHYPERMGAFLFVGVNSNYNSRNPSQSYFAIIKIASAILSAIDQNLWNLWKEGREGRSGIVNNIIDDFRIPRVGTNDKIATRVLHK